MTSNAIMNPHVSIIILNWNGWRDTIECLESLYQIIYPNYDVILVDNFSTDDSIKKITSYCQGDIKVNSPYTNYSIKNKPIYLFEYTKEEVENQRISFESSKIKNLKSNRKLHLIKVQEKNIMWAGGTNLGLKFCIENLAMDYILLLNNDMVFEKNFLMELVKFTQLEKNKKIGLLSPRVCLYDSPDQNQWSVFQNVKKPIECKASTGSAMFINPQIIKKIGFIDRRFGLYHEDVDYSYRTYKAGYKVYYIPTRDKILHKGSNTTKTIKGYGAYYGFKNYLLLNVKHKSYLDFLFFLVKYTLRTYIPKLIKIPKEIRKYALKGFIKAIKQILMDRTLLLHHGYKNFWLYNEYNTLLK
ncbi:MAG: glycosyltransferase family 2 protein [Candidatus Hodarchaeota archaeon]